MSVFQKLLALMVLKTTPQDMPYSVTLLVQLVVFYVLSGVVVLQTTISNDDTVAYMVLGLLVQIVFTYIVLGALDKSVRFMQTFGALIGANLIFNLMSWPVLAVLSDGTSQDVLKSFMSLLILLLVSWEILVKAHIFKHALEMKIFGALALSFSLFFISFTLSQLLFPAETAG